MKAPCLNMAQVKAINTRKVNKVDGHTIFNMVKNMTGVRDEEILTVITPTMVPMIGRNAPTQTYGMMNDETLRSFMNCIGFWLRI